MTKASENSKAMRGTKRACPVCEARFYDLAREAIVCPSCGAPYTPAPRPVADPGTYTRRLAGKAGWRGRSLKPPTPASEADTERAVSRELATEEEPDSVAEIDADADLVLEQEAEDGDLSGLVDRDADEAKEA